MTHTLHPEIENWNPKLRDELLALGMSLERAWDDGKWHITMANIVRERLWEYLQEHSDSPPYMSPEEYDRIVKETSGLNELYMWPSNSYTATSQSLKPMKI